MRIYAINWRVRWSHRWLAMFRLDLFRTPRVEVAGMMKEMR
jgi:hypothetical protein